MSSKCLILAAGMATRLQPLTSRLPKCCLEITKGESLIERLVKQISNFTDTSEIVVCVGFEAQKIITKLQPMSVKNLKYCFNPDYKTTNNMYSAWLALKDDEVHTDLLIINADCVYDDQMIKRTQKASKSTIFFDSLKWDEESMKIELSENGLVTNIAKTIEKDDNSYVSIDLYKFKSADAQNYLSSIEEFVNQRELRLWNELAIQRMIKKKMNLVYGYDIVKLPWFEIDTIQDYQNAKLLFSK